jgi:CheY-like chemotaxis protein
MQHEMAEDLDTARPYLSSDFSFDMIFCDLGGSDPNVNLQSKVEKLRQGDGNRLTPIILMTPLVDWNPSFDPAQHRYVHRITKPILLQELHYTVRLALTYKSPTTRSYASLTPDGMEDDFSDLGASRFVPYILPFARDLIINPKLKILLAEDNLVNQRVTSLLLKKIGFTIDAVSTGTEAVQAVRGGTYDVVLMDKLMPGMDGIEATLHIRELENIEQPVIIALTASASMEDEMACRRATMDNFLSKPVQFEKMKAALAFASNLLEQRRLEGKKGGRLIPLSEEEQEEA